MKYLKKFKSKEEYNAFGESFDAVFDTSCHAASVFGNSYYHDNYEPLYIEAINDLYFSNNNNSFEYSFDGKQWISEVNPVFVASGCKLYIKPMSKPTVTGRFKLGGFFEHPTSSSGWSQYAFKDNEALISLEDIVFGNGNDINGLSYFFDGCVNLEKFPRVLHFTQDDGLIGRGMFWDSSKPVKAPIILLKSISNTTDVNIEYMFRSCNKIKELKIFAESYIDTGRYGGNVNFTGIFPGSSEGELILNNTIVDSYYVFTKAQSQFPPGWKIKICNLDTDSYYIKFLIGTSTYNADADMTWEEWVNSDYNTKGFVINEDFVELDGTLLYFKEEPVKTSDIINCFAQTPYTIGIS